MSAFAFIRRPAGLSDSRLLSAAELLLGALVVIGHNVWRIVPNEVLVLFAAGLLSLWLRNGGWSAIGIRRPASWSRTVLIAASAAALRLGLGEWVIDPLTARVWPPPVAPSGAEEITGNLPYALLALLVVWTFAAFGEETVYRGYLLLRAADLGRGSAAAWWIGMIFTSILFGYGHYYKGPAGIIDSGIAGLILGAAYLLSGRNLWASILAHGFINSFGVTVLYLGWDS
jgi:membrane protease YdiL (CAAX protease family)